MMARMELEVSGITCVVTADLEDTQLSAVLDTLVAPCLLGVGYHWDTVWAALGNADALKSREAGRHDEA